MIIILFIYDLIKNHVEGEIICETRVEKGCRSLVLRLRLWWYAGRGSDRYREAVGDWRSPDCVLDETITTAIINM